MQHLLLWRLAVGGGSDLLLNLPDISAAYRSALARAGLVAVKKITNPKTGRKVNHLSLTDDGWAWCQENMTWPRTRSQQADTVLERLLPRMHTIFQRRETVDSLGDFIGKSHVEATESRDEAEKRESATPDLRQVIRETCRALGNGREGVRIRLADLRSHLNGFGKDEVTRALWELSERGELALYRLDDPREITEADREAAVRTSTGEEKHILYFGGTAS
jgi:hypothetical protein